MPSCLKKPRHPMVAEFGPGLVGVPLRISFDSAPNVFKTVAHSTYL